MYTVNFKTRLGISVILASMLLSGCKAGNANSQSESAGTSSARAEESSSVPAESSVASSTQPVESSAVPAESSVASPAQPVESGSLPEEDPPYSEPPDLFPAGRVYPDEELFPSEWLRVASRAESAEKIGEILRSDTSGKDPESAIAVLMDRNILFYSLFLNGLKLFEIENSPYNSPDFENPIYPITSEYFSDVQSIYDLAYDTYEHSAAEDLLYGLNGEPRLTDKNGRMYINNTQFPNLSSPAFVAQSYIEITEKTKNKCTFIWHYPDVEMLNPPESGYEFCYFEKTYTAKYIDGSWKLSAVVFDNM